MKMIFQNPNENGDIKFDLNQYIHETDTPVSLEINEYKERTRSALALDPDLPEVLNIYEKDGNSDFVTDKYGNMSLNWDWAAGFSLII